LGDEGTVYEKDWIGDMDMKNHRVYYEVNFDRSGYITMDHRAIRKVVQPKDEDFEKISSFFSQ
jgi:hypothetical protein